MTAKITLYGMMTYMKELYDIDIFGEITLPEGIDRDALIDVILHESGEFEVLYPDGNFLKNMISNFFATHYWTFDKWAKAIELEYNPIENYDRQEDETVNITDHATGSTINSGEQTSDSTTKDTHKFRTEVNDNISAFNSSTMQPNTTSTSISEGLDGDNNKIETEMSETSSGTSTSENDGTSDTIRTSRIHGNIGVTTSQQMLESEFKIARFNLYQQINDLFADNLLITVYS